MNLGDTSRSGAFTEDTTSPADPVPTSTTKALLLSIAVPRIYRVYIPPKQQSDAIPNAQCGSERSDGSAAGATTRKTESSKAESSVSSRPDEDDANKRKEDEPLSTMDKASTAATGTATKKIRLLQAREEAPFSPDDHGFSDNASKEEGMKSTISKIATLLVGNGAETNEQDDEASEDEVRVLNVEDENTRGGSIQEHELGYVEGDEDSVREGSIVEHVVTKEEMETIVKIAPSEEGEEESESVGEGKPGHTRRQRKPDAITAASDAIKNFSGVINKSNDGLSTSYLSREEAVAAIKQYEPGQLSQAAIMELDNEGEQKGENKKPNTEIKLEELLRLTFRNLYAENHFYNAPIYTNVQTRMLEQAEMDEWVELSVMTKQASIGIILERLERIGVGSSVGSIAIYKAELLRACDILNDDAPQEHPTVNLKNAEGDQGSSDVDDDTAAQKAAKMEAARAEWKNAASRLRVEQVKEQIQEQAELSLDYLSLLTIASILAGIGLVLDNAVVIVASMLVSPIMGPVMGMTFGTQVLDWGLAVKSCWHEFVSLLFAVLIGVVIGIAVSFCPAADSWPAEQMSSRGEINGLVAGIAIAIPSGMGVAVSILGNNTSSLVGVAISASLLPPAVNAGVCWVYAILIRAGYVDAPFNEDTGEVWDFNLMAVISFALTMINIVCVWLSGMVMFGIKEVAPTRSKSAFWSRDIKFARALQKGSKGINLDTIKTGLQDAIKNERKEKSSGKKAEDEETGAKASRRSMKVPSKRYNGFNFNMSINPVDDTNPVVDIDDYAGPDSPTDAKYYGLEDMAKLLGFGDEKQD